MLLITYWLINGHPCVRKGSIYRTGVVLKTKTDLISIECGMGYHTSKTTIPHHTLSPFHFMTSFQSEKH